MFQPTPPAFYNSKPTPTRIFPIVISNSINIVDQSVAIIDAHMFPCQKCGYKDGVGNIEYKAGNVALGWGALLFLFTGLFCFLPCVNSNCKDAHFSCARCHYKKAIVKPKCCCWMVYQLNSLFINSSLIIYLYIKLFNTLFDTKIIIKRKI